MKTVESLLNGYRWTRSFIRYLFGKSIFEFAYKRQTKSYGSKECHWRIIPDNLKEDSIVYSFGLGEDIRFESDIARLHNCTVYAFDPTPKSLKFVEKEAKNLPLIKVYPYALAADDGIKKFHLPKNQNHVSGSLIENDGTSTDTIEVPCHSIEFLMRKFGHERMDLLKMDIEGNEYEVLESLAAHGVLKNINQICVEFHFRFDKNLVKRTKHIFRILKDCGFSLVYSAANQEEFTFFQTKLFD